MVDQTYPERKEVVLKLCCVALLTASTLNAVGAEPDNARGRYAAVGFKQYTLGDSFEAARRKGSLKCDFATFVWSFDEKKFETQAKKLLAAKRRASGDQSCELRSAETLGGMPTSTALYFYRNQLEHISVTARLPDPKGRGYQERWAEHKRSAETVRSALAERFGPYETSTEITSRRGERNPPHDMVFTWKLPSGIVRANYDSLDPSRVYVAYKSSRYDAEFERANAERDEVVTSINKIERAQTWERQKKRLKDA